MQVTSASGILTSRGLLVREVQLYALCEEITSWLIYFMLIFSPWAFGTTQPWAIWVLNICGYSIGVGLCLKWYIRQVKQHRPRGAVGRMVTQLGLRQGNSANAALDSSSLEVRSLEKLNELMSESGAARAPELAPVLVRTLGGLTISILAYCLIAALNARATVDPASGQLVYKQCISWLPHSFDSQSTWQVFARLVALACFFWAMRDWTGRELGPKGGGVRIPVAGVPPRIRSVLWVLSISGALLALEGIVQRLVGSSKLLFLVKPEIHQEWATQFAAFAYRANAAQYFNLLWPMALGFGWVLHRQRRASRSAYLLFWCAGVMAACPIISGSRGAALVDVGMLLLAVTTLLGHLLLAAPTRPRSQNKSVLLLLSFCGGTLVLGGVLGGRQLSERLTHAATDLRGRQEIYDCARRMTKDYALFGTGPGSFERVFQLYRTSAEGYWPAQLHNDWLETRITFGWVGSALIGAALLDIVAHWLRNCSRSSVRYLAIFIWLGIAGCLVQARWDFPLQLYSIDLLFVCGCSLLLSLSEVVEAA